MVKTALEMQSGRIEIIPGRNRLLLIAPHGHKEDDENTGTLTREIAQTIKCYAIINETYLKPGKHPNPRKHLIDLNRKDQVEKYLREKFLGPLLGFVDEIIEKYGSCLILWIHGIEDGNINSDSLEQGVPSADILVGIGQGEKDRRTARKETVEQLIQYLRENEVKPVIAAMAKEESGYCGYDLQNMNQYFREKYDLSKLESIQLEIKFTGFRDKNSISNTAKALSKAFEKMAAPALIMEQESLVEKAYKNLMDIFSKHFRNAMIEAGQYLINTFYDGDIEKARRKEPVENQSFYQLLKRLNPRESGGPSKSWVYNAINLAIQNSDLSNFSTYRKLNLSHQVLLLPIRKIEDKKRLCIQTIEQNLTVAQLREEIKKLQNNEGKSHGIPKTLKRIIGNPKILFSEENKSATEMGSLLQHDIDNLKDLLTKAQAKKTEIDEEINQLAKFSQNYEILTDRIAKAIRENRHKAASSRTTRQKRIEISTDQQPGSRKKKAYTTIKKQLYYEGKTGLAESKGFQKKELADLACNIGNICQFGCSFCYVPAIVRKQKNVQEVLHEGYGWDDISHYRTKENVMKCVERDLRKIRPDDKRTVIFCTTCDPCATKEHADITSSAILLIMKRSDLQVRVLSKSTLIFDIAEELDEYRDRIVYGLSTGTIRPEISACIEGNASPIEERLETLNLLQEAGYRTFGMLCPILPSEMPHLEKLVKAINPDRCEHVWAEAINRRGKSLEKTRDQLKQCGLDTDAQLLEDVMEDRDIWRGYSKDLYLMVRQELEKRGASDKLRYLQYVTREPDDFKTFFKSQKGALLLGEKELT